MLAIPSVLCCKGIRQAAAAAAEVLVVAIVVVDVASSVQVTTQTRG